MSEGSVQDSIPFRSPDLIETSGFIGNRKSPWRLKLILIAWLATLGVDFLWHGGILADIYNHPHPALLEPEQAFLRIPLGYGSLLIQVVFVYWLFTYIGVSDWKKGFRVGLMFGGILGIASILGQYSILTLELGLLILWGIGQVFEFCAVGLILGAGSSVASLKSIATKASVFVIIAVFFTIVMQSVIH
ncbi:MAG: hypothetical protein ACFFEE_02855 [Candidatus Thorarchaeota archaeon]